MLFPAAEGSDLTAGVDWRSHVPRAHGIRHILRCRGPRLYTKKQNVAKSLPDHGIFSPIISAIMNLLHGCKGSLRNNFFNSTEICQGTSATSPSHPSTALFQVLFGFSFCVHKDDFSVSNTLLNTHNLLIPIFHPWLQCLAGASPMTNADFF